VIMGNDRNDENFIHEVFPTCFEVSFEKEDEFFQGIFKEDSENFFKDLKSSKNLKIISFWKPRDTFHLGQYFCLSVLTKLLEIGKATDVTIILGQDVKDIQHSALMLRTLITKEFIRRMSSKSDLIKIKESKDYYGKVDSDIINKFPQFQAKVKEVQSSLWASEPTKKWAEQIERRKWFNTEEFVTTLAQALKVELPESGGDSTYLLSGLKHMDIWYFFKQVFSPNLKVVFIKNVLGLDAQPQSSSTTPGEKRFDLEEASESKLERKLRELLRQRQFGTQDIPKPRDLVYKIVGLKNSDLYWKLIHLEEVLEGEPSDDESINNQIINSLKEFFSDRSKEWLLWKNKLLQIETNLAINNSFIYKYALDAGLAKERVLKIEPGSCELNGSPERFRNLYRGLIENCLDTVIAQAGYSDTEQAKNLKILTTKTSSLDKVLFFFEKWHRDHSLHQFNVAVLGDFLLHAYVKENSNTRLIDEVFDYTKGLNKEITIEEIRLSWWTAALLHDHAYPLEMLLRRSSHWKTVEDVTETSQDPKTSTSQQDPKTSTSQQKSMYQIVFELVYDYIASELRGIFKMFPMDESKLKQFGDELFRALGLGCPFDYMNHGHLGALNTAAHLGFIWNDTIIPEKITLPWLKFALKAIALHEAESKILLGEEPILFLLVLCDELQEWTRRQFSQNRTNPELMHSIDQITILFQERLKGLGHYEFPEVLKVDFKCKGDEVLEELGWQRKIFTESKTKQLKRLDFNSNRSEDFKPKGIKFSITIPQEL